MRNMETMMNQAEVDKEIEFMEMGLAGQGGIEAKDDQHERLDEITERIASGEFHRPVAEQIGGKKLIICRCIDGRCLHGPAEFLAPNSAGGSESLFVATDLTTGHYQDDGSTVGGYNAMLTDLTERGFMVGGHIGPHAGGEKSDCGANDKLDLIYAYLVQNANGLRDMAESLGVSISGETLSKIVSRAKARASFSTGAELLAKLESFRDRAVIDQLAGEHNEVVAAVNTRPRTTLDRDALKAEFGDNYQSFNVDVWAFEDAAKAVSINPEDLEEVREKVAAMVLYNLATAGVLTGPKMRIVVVQ